MKRNLLVSIVLLFSLNLLAQEIDIQGQMDSNLPVDPNVRVGKLDNGLTYYIRHNEKPDNRVQMRLVVNAGSMQEDEDQLGMAHFVEHMAFNGTKNFKKNDIVDFLQSIGVEFGADLNAYTSFDETVYILPLPTDDEEILDKGMQVLEDWAHNVTLSEEEIDKERGVVLEEWRLGRGADQRMRDEYFPIMFKNSRYAERLPIGTQESIENATYQAIRRFYNDWYRPDLMSIIAVGDIDVDQMEAKIKDRFGQINGPENSRERTMYTVPDHEETYIAVTSDKETSFISVRLYYKAGNVETNTFGDFRRDMVFQLYNGMLGNRMHELTQSADPPFFIANTSFGSMVRSKSAYQSFAVVGETGIEKGLKALIEENQRVLQHGFTQGELDRYKKEMINGYEQYYKERDKTESRIYTGEYIRAYLTDEPIPGIEFEFAFVKSVLPTISIEDVNALASQWITKENRVVVITATVKEGVKLPTEPEIRAMLDEADNMEITPYEEEELGSELMTTIPVAGSVTNSVTFEKTEVAELTLSNGVRVVLKPTDFKNDEILISATSPGGTSVYSDEDYISATFASDILNQSGVGEFSVVDLQKLFAGKTVQVSAFISDLSEGFNGNAAPKDLETLLQMIHLYFTAPRKDESAYQSLITRYQMLFQNLMANPQFFYQDQVSKIMTQNNPRGGGFPTMEDLEKINFERSYEIFRDRFADAGDFTFVFVGNFDITEITPQLETYLGSLPTSGREETWKDLGIRPPKGVVEKTVYKGTDPKSMVTINFTGTKPYNKKSNYNLSSLGEVLSIKLIEILREEKSGVYGVGASGSSSKYPEESYTFSIRFPCAPENVDDLVSAAIAEVDKIKNEGVADEDMQKIKEQQRRDREENLKKNRYWLNHIGAYYKNGTSLDTFYDYETNIDELTSDDLKAAANTYINMENYVKIVLMPEEKED